MRLVFAGIFGAVALAACQPAEAPDAIYHGGTIYTGVNVESASYGLTICAERVALFKAVSEGERDFAAVAVVTDTATPTAPCGACRQLLWEYAGDVPVILANLTSVVGRYTTSDLLPAPFDRRSL